MNLLDRYEEVVGHQEVQRLRRLAARLQGKRIVHVNSTRSGGGGLSVMISDCASDTLGAAGTVARRGFFCSCMMHVSAYVT